MNIHKNLALASLLVIGLLSTGATQEITMKEHARSQGGTFINSIYLTPPLLPMAELVRASDLIVRGRITEKSSRLSDDESMIFTDFMITPVRILKRPADLGTATVPGRPLPIILQAVGGTLDVDGLHLETQSNAHDRDRPLTIGGEYVFFLMKPVPSGATTRRVRAGAFELAAGINAVFPIRAGKIEPFTRVAAKIRPLPTDDPEAFLGSIQKLVETREPR